MKVTVTVLGALLATGLCGLAGAADVGAVYVWTDKDGTPHFQDRPPDGGQTVAKEMSLRYKLTDSASVAAATKQLADEQAAKDKRDEQQSEDAAAAKAEKAKLLSEREKGCATARERLEQYDSARRVYRPGPNGERIYLTSEEIDAARADARRTVDEWCDQ